ncbi:hypothetical protein PVAND_001862 [Polypedilum vanderplanki]|uniref:Peptidase S1 domain-containing protein n=1 Tax=Polypedilum vanderplanki TaxID=319348 RepID=A0A9J6BPI2_POLVA|nr:hypothetical protein PVAND_001862 [Polypedilum vanderplanki]
MVLKIEQKLIFAIFLLFQIFEIIANESCILSTGKAGVCVPIKTCERDLDAFVFETDFCANNFSEICCESVNLRISLDESPKEIKTTRDFESYASYKLFDSSKCGKIDEIERISGGEEADLLEFPWNALIGYQSKTALEFLCGGSLINEFYVLTCAHCLVNPNGRIRLDVKLVRLGEYRKSTTEDCKILSDEQKLCADPVQDIEVNRRNLIVHSDFSYLEKIHDIGLIKISKAKMEQNNIKPICLPFEERFETLPKSLVVIGFGRTEKSSNNSDVLLKAKVQTISNEKCFDEFKKAKSNIYFSINNDLQFCAGDIRDSCRGDSGSSIQFPQIFEGTTVRQVQYGIVSFGDIDCGSHFPGIYTKIYPYISWILENVK